jgi:hypothetical protein
MILSDRLESRRCPEIATTLLGLGITLLTTIASAATFTWNCPTNGNWSVAANWTNGTVPDNDGTADIVLTNVNTGAGGHGNTTCVDQPWSVAGVRYAHQAVWGALNLAHTGNGSLSIGAGGIAGGSASPCLNQRAPIQFTTPDSYIKNNMYWYGNVDSTCSGGTRVHLQVGDFRADTMTTTTHVFYYLESGGPALYGESLNSLGSNKVYVTLADPAINPATPREIGFYGLSTSNHLYFDTPIELDAATIRSGDNRYFSLLAQRTGTVRLVTHVRGSWTLANGKALSNKGGIGWLWLNGGGRAGNNVSTRTYYEQDGRSLVSDGVGPNDWGGDIFVYFGIHVINAPHAFKENNRAFFNLGGCSGGTTEITNNMLLATSGNGVTGIIRLFGGDAVTGGSPGELNRQWATLGLEGTGEVEFKGQILMDRRPTSETHRAMNLILLAGPDGTATFSGGIAESSLNGTAAAGLVHVAGGGTVVLSGANAYTNTTTVLRSTTLRLDGSLASTRLEVGPGAILSGSGQAGGRLSSSGTVAPGPKGLKVGGDAEFLSGSELRVQLPADGGNAGILEVGGGLDLSNATLALSGGRANTTYTIATAGQLAGRSVARIDASRLQPGLNAGPAQVQMEGNRLRVTILKGGSPTAAAGIAPEAPPGSALWVNGMPAGDPIAAEAGGLKVRTPKGVETLIPWSSLSPGTRYRHEPGFPDRLRPPGAPADAEPLWQATPRT